LVAVAVAGASARADVVYNVQSLNHPQIVVFSHDAGESSSTDEHPGGFEVESQSGQHVTLAGSARFVTQVDLSLTGWRNSPAVPPTTASLAMTLRIYAFGAVTPGALLWEGTSSVQTFAVPTFSQAPAIPVSFQPNVLLPDEVILAISHTQISGQVAESLIGNVASFPGPVVGAGDTNWFSQDTATGVWSRADQPNVYLQARITAIPEPAGLGLAGVLLIAARRRRTG
jgi:hypothetical protein